MDLDPAVRQLFDEQCGLATRPQLYRFGVTEDALRWRLGRCWAPALGVVVSASRDRLTTHQRLVAPS
jgi:hypothetical protein